MQGPSDLYEFTWDGGNARWSSGIIFTVTGAISGALACGNGRNDGVNRLYVSEDHCGAKLYELSWNGTSWNLTNRSDSDSASSGTLDLVLGDGRNDGVNRLYAAIRTQLPKLYSAIEWSWNGATYVPAAVGLTTDTVAYGGLMLAMGKGRNDGLNRIYHSEKDAVGWARTYEYSYQGGAWHKRYAWKHPQEDFNLSLSLYLGALRPDGLVRGYSLYLGGEPYDDIYESTYVKHHPGRYGLLFSPSLVASVRSPATMTVGEDPCGSGQEQLFYSDAFGRVQRLYWDGGGWVNEVIDRVGRGFMTVADGRNDGVPRLYVAGARGYLYELSCVPQSTEEAEPVQPLTLRAEAGALRFTLPAASAVNLALYDASGRRRATLFSGTLAAGEHAFALPELPRGVYVARLTADGRSVGVTLVR